MYVEMKRAGRAATLPTLLINPAARTLAGTMAKEVRNRRMSFIRGNDNLPRPEIFTSHAGSQVLNRVVKRPIQGISREGLPLDMPGYVGTYANQDGQAVPLGVVSTTYEVVQMRDLCELAETAMMNTFTPEQLNEIEIRDSSANKGAFVKREYVIKAFAEALEYGNATAQTVKPWHDRRCYLCHYDWL